MIKHCRILPLLFLAGCATAPKVYNLEKKSGQWEANLRITDQKKNKTYSLSLDVIAERPQQLRAEVSGTLGVALASVVIRGDQVSYAAHRTKKYYTGKTSDQALEPVLQVRFDPKFLLNLFFDEPIKDNGWTCLITPDHVLSTCVRELDKLLIQWIDRNGENKKISITGSDFQIDIVVKDFQTKVQNLDKAFVLPPPPGYKSYKLDESVH